MVSFGIPTIYVSVVRPPVCDLYSLRRHHLLMNPISCSTLLYSLVDCRLSNDMENAADQISSLPLLCFCLLVLILARTAYNFRRLSIPGPFLASISDLWRFYHQNRGHGLRTKLLDLHLQHGPVVRYGVRSVSISSPDAISRIYGSRAGFITADSYKVLVGISNGKEVPSLVSTADEVKHGALRRSIAGAFTPNGVLPLEQCIDQTMRELRDILAQKPEAIDLPMWMSLFSMDSAARQAFGEDRGYLAAGKDVDGSIQLIRNRFNHWGRWSSLPGVESLIYRNAVSINRKQTPSSMAAAAIAKLSSRISTTGTEESYHRPPTVFRLCFRSTSRPPRQDRHCRSSHVHYFGCRRHNSHDL